MATYTFLIDSDLHFGAAKTADGQLCPRDTKSGNVEKIAGILDKQKVDALIVTGDLTATGMDGKGCFGGDRDELGSLINDYVLPCEARLPVKLCPGNHDDYPHGCRKPVITYLKKRHGDVKYSFRIGHIFFACCGIYPDRITLKWLKTELDRSYPVDTPIVLFFHYNLQGQWSDWWSDEEKDQFYEVIKNYNIVMIATGHCHNTIVEDWRGIKTVRAAGSKLLLCRIDMSTTPPALTIDHV